MCITVCARHLACRVTCAPAPPAPPLLARACSVKVNRCDSFVCDCVVVLCCLSSSCSIPSTCSSVLDQSAEKGALEVHCPEQNSKGCPNSTRETSQSHTSSVTVASPTFRTPSRHFGSAARFTVARRETMDHLQRDGVGARDADRWRAVCLYSCSGSLEYE